MDQKLELIFIPAPGLVGHIISSFEMAKLIINLHSRISVTILIIRQPGDVRPIPESPSPRLKFLELHHETSSGPPAPPHHVLYRLIDEHKPNVRKIVEEMKSSGEIRIAGIVIDMFLGTMIDVANEFEIPSYLFYTSGAAFLGLMFHMQNLTDELKVDVMKYENSDAEIVVGTYVNPVPTKVLPRGFFDDGGRDPFISLSRRYRETKGILVNTFQELEAHAIQALNKDGNIPPVYAIGPLLKQENSLNQSVESEIILKWLHLQPDSSVVFLCFGSLGHFGDEQVKQIAHALENSGFRFLWSLRKAQPKGNFDFLAEEIESLQDVILPEGFLQRNAEVGKVIGWAPQMAVLSHPAVGGFVTHCGWNSMLESTWHGVPMAAWPLYAEQQINSFLLVKDLEMAVEIKMDYVSEKEELVSAQVIENGIRKLMDPDNVGIRKKLKEMKEKIRLAVMEDGSSSASLKCFLKNVVDNSSSSTSS